MSHPNVGASAGPFRDQITSEKVRMFCQSLGMPERNTLPPTYLTVFRKGEFELFQKLGIPLSQILHTDQTYEFLVPIQIGDEVEFKTEVTQVLEKAKMQFLSFETEFKVENRAVAKAISTIVVRGL